MYANEFVNVYYAHSYVILVCVYLLAFYAHARPLALQHEHTSRRLRELPLRMNVWYFRLPWHISAR